jgi:hypothetical protein
MFSISVCPPEGLGQQYGQPQWKILHVSVFPKKYQKDREQIEHECEASFPIILSGMSFWKIRNAGVYRGFEIAETLVLVRE